MAGQALAMVVSTEMTGQAQAILACTMKDLVPAMVVFMETIGLALVTEVFMTMAGLVLATEATGEPTSGTCEGYNALSSAFLGSHSHW